MERVNCRNGVVTTFVNMIPWRYMTSSQERWGNCAVEDLQALISFRLGIQSISNYQATSRLAGEASKLPTLLCTVSFVLPVSIENSTWWSDLMLELLKSARVTHSGGNNLKFVTMTQVDITLVCMTRFKSTRIRLFDYLTWLESVARYDLIWDLWN